MENIKGNINIETTSEETKNKNFVQLYRDNMKAIRWLSSNNSTALELFLFIS